MAEPQLPSPPAAPTRRVGRETAALLFATMFPQTALSMMSLSPPVLAEAVTRQYGLPAEVTGTYSGLVYAFILIGNLLSAALIQRLGALRSSFACVLVGAVGVALFGEAGVPGLLVGTILVGLAYGPLTPASSQAIAHQAGSPSFILIVSIRQTSVPLGGVLAGLLVPPLVLRVGWSATLTILGGLSAVAAAAFVAASPLVRRERPASGHAARRRLLDPLRVVIASPTLLKYGWASAIFAAVQLVLSSFLVVFLVTVVGYDLVAAGLLLSASQVAGIVGRPAWGYLADRTGRSRAVLVGLGIGMGASSALACLLPLLGPSWLAVPLVIAFGATATGWNGVFIAQIMRQVAPAEVGLATSGGLIFTYGGVVVGPPVFGALAHLAGFTTAFLTLAVFALVGAGLVAATARDGRRAA